MQMPGRKFSAGSSSYRYGFNGKENDNEVKGEGNQQDYGMRIYDPRLGRFLSVDPLTPDYPELTPYQFASNTPIQATDLDGLEAEFSAGKVFKRKSYKNYGGFFSNVVGNGMYENTIGNNLSTAVQNQVVDMTEDIVNVFSTSGRDKLLYEKYGPAVYLLIADFGTMSSDQQLNSLKNYFSKGENIENLMASAYLILAFKYVPTLKVPTALEPYYNLLKQVFSGEKKILKVGSLEGVRDFVVKANKSAPVITDIDLIRGNTLIEEKTATSGFNRYSKLNETAKWVKKHITEKFKNIVEARKYLPKEYQNADIQFHFTKKGATSSFKKAVNSEIKKLRTQNPDINLTVKWE
jgi:RHS repeat-associated protein